MIFKKYTVILCSLFSFFLFAQEDCEILYGSCPFTKITKVTKTQDNDYCESYQAHIINDDTIIATYYKNGEEKGNIFCCRMTPRRGFLARLPESPDYFYLLKDLAAKNNCSIGSKY